MYQYLSSLLLSSTLCQVLSLLAAIILALYIYGKWPFLGLNLSSLRGPDPTIYLGNMAALLSERVYEVHLRYKKHYGDLVRVFEGRQAGILIFDKEMIKEVTVRRATEFTNRRDLILRGLLRESLLNLKDNSWRRIRNILTPAFSGSKLRQMMPLISHTADNLVDHMQGLCSKNQEIELRKLCNSYTLDVICSTSFGLDVNTIKNPEDPVIKNTANMVEFKPGNPVIMLTFFFPFLNPLFEYFNFSIMPHNNAMFLAKIIKAALKERKESGTVRPDLLQLMVQASRAHDEELMSHQNILEHDRKGLTEDEIAAQCILFLFAGYETTANALSFFLHTFVTNPECQQKAREEIDAMYEQLDGKELTYEAVSSLRYLDLCLTESLRLYSPAFITDRCCSQDVEVKGHQIPAGTLCIIPLQAMHRDPDLWEDPDAFNPERHESPIDPYQYMPFGIGQRNCIGTRLAQVEIKAAAVHILRNFNLITCSKTKPAVIAPGLILKAQDGLWMKLEKRQLS